MLSVPVTFALLALVSTTGVTAADAVLSAYTAPGEFPTSVYASYWNNLTATSAQPQPVISDPVTNTIFPANLPDPANFPKSDTVDPHPLPLPQEPSQLLQQAFSPILSIATNPALYGDNFFTQVVALGDMGGYDGQLCPLPPTLPLNLTEWFAKPKPKPLPPPKQPSGERLKVLHVSDIHIDFRYAIGYAANCSQYMCCRENAFNTASPDQVLLAMELTTGDITSHDPDNQYSRAYMIPYAMGGVLGNQFNWLYDHVSTMWYYEGWLPEASVEHARTHYAAYTLKRPDGLRIISLDTDMYVVTATGYTSNYFSYINGSQPDPFGILRFLTDELQDAEDAGDRGSVQPHEPILPNVSFTYTVTGPDDHADAWQKASIVTHHMSSQVRKVDEHGRATELTLSTIDIFFGHTHEDQLSVSVCTKLTLQYVPVFLPVDLRTHVTPQTFDILDAYTWISRVDEFPELDNQTEVGPTYVLEYSTRDAYGQNITWGANDPLNATWWHLVTEQIEYNSSLVETFNTYQSKSSVAGLNCIGECIPAKICYAEWIYQHLVCEL
ncbi:hypothetical protein OG21DRAFT_1523118 [Imleria badia]|nr:hypothetical protein OG21DRAFT_1523118 [Imleria badia]